MGAWGYETLADDTALDFLDEWMECRDPLANMSEVLEDALESETLDYTQAHGVSVLAMVVDHVVNGISEVDQGEVDGIDGYEAWLGSLNRVKIEDLKLEVAHALDGVIDENCELAQLWSESTTLYGQWHQNQIDRRDRLLPKYDLTDKNVFC